MMDHTGRCTCGAVRYALARAPIVVHCCHCRWCQRESGAAFALNALIETAQLTVLAGTPDRIATPSASGRGQTIVRCPGCRVALWSHYGGTGEAAAFVRVGTLEAPDRCPPGAHIFTASKQPWVVIPAGAESFPGYYTGKDVVRIYGAEGAARWRALRG